MADSVVNWDEPATAAPNASVEKDWIKTFESAIGHMLVDWQTALSEHETAIQFRREAGLPIFDDGWTEQNEQAYQSMGHVVDVISRYYVELKNGLRGIGKASGDIGVVAELGETQVVIDNAKFVFRNADQQREGADPSGFVGLTGAEVAVGIAGAVVVVAVTVGTVYAVSSVCQVIRDKLAVYREKSVQAYERSLTEKGVSEAEAHAQAMDYMKHSEQLAASRSQEQNPGGDLVSTIKTALWVTFAVAAIGGAVYFFGPMVRNALSSRGGHPQLAQANPVRELDEFTEAYIETALWSSTDESDESGGLPLDENYTVSDIAPETLKKMISDCERFQLGNMKWLVEGSDSKGGHDFWLTRNGHGAGFWDGDWPEPEATYLTESSKKFGEYDLYVGDDGLIYGTPG